jgi:hypothetical protein
LVAMRARKPWTRARLSTLGWKVRFMMMSQSGPSAGSKPVKNRSIRASRKRAAILGRQGLLGNGNLSLKIKSLGLPRTRFLVCRAACGEAVSGFCFSAS